MASPPNTGDRDKMHHMVYTRLTQPSEGGFSDSVPVTDKKGKMIRSDGHVTLFGMTATAYAEHILRKPGAAGKAEAERLFREVGPYVQRSGDYVADVPAAIRARLDAFRTDSFNMWRQVHLINQRFDRFQSPILQGIAADISYHMGVDGSYRILAQAANIPVPRDLKDPAWRESVLTAIQGMELRLGPEATIQKLAEAKQAAHTSIRDFWIQRRDQSAQRLAELKDNTTQAYAEEYYKRYLPALTRADNHIAWQRGFEARLSSYKPLYAQLAGPQGATLPTITAAADTDAPILTPPSAIKRPTLHVSVSQESILRDGDQMQELILRMSNDRESALKLFMGGRIRNIQITDGTSTMGLNADPAKNPNITGIAVSLLNMEGIRIDTSSEPGILKITVPNYEAARALSAMDETTALQASRVYMPTAVSLGSPPIAVAGRATGVPQVITDWITHGGILVNGERYSLPAGTPDEITRKMKETFSNAEAVTVMGSGPLAEKIKEWIGKAANVYAETESETGAPNAARKAIELKAKEHIQELEIAIRTLARPRQRADAADPAALRVNLVLANVGVTAAPRDDGPALPDEVRKQASQGGRDTGTAATV